jgi:hypothetical protein
MKTKRQIEKGKNISSNKKVKNINNPVLKILDKIWNNIIILKVIASISTAITLFSGYYFIIEKIDRYQIEKSVAYCEKINRIDQIPESEIQTWTLNLERIGKDPKYKDYYNYLKGLENMSGEHKYAGGYLLANDYLNKVSIDSKYYPNAVLLRCRNYYKNLPKAQSIEKINLLIKSLESNEIYFPEYFSIRLFILVLEKKHDELDSLYSDFKNYAPHSSAFDTMIISTNTPLYYSPEIFLKAEGIDYLIKWHICLGNKKSKYFNSFISYFEKLNASSDDNFIEIKTSLDLIGMIDPYSLHYNLDQKKLSNKDWVLVQRRAINELLSGQLCR